MAIVVTGRGPKSGESIGVMSQDMPPVIVGGVSSPGKIVVVSPPRAPHPPLRARAPNLPGKIHNYAEESGERVSFRPHPDDVARSIHEIQTRHLRPAPPVAQPKIHEGHEDSAYVVKPEGWVAEPPNFPPKLGPTPFSIRPKSQKYPIKAPRPVLMLEGVIHGGGAQADEPLVVLPVGKRKLYPVKIHDFGNWKTYSVEVE